MPKIAISRSMLNSLLGFKLQEKDYEEAFLYAKCEIDSIEGDTIKLDCKDINRLDLWSTEGIARQLRAVYTKDKGIQKYKLNNVIGRISVSSSVKNIRPYISAGAVLGLMVTDKMIEQIIQIQEKICLTFGSQRKNVAIGLYDFDKIKMPLQYKTAKPDEIKFVPLEFNKKISLREILETHAKGREYGHLIKHFSSYPILIDSAGNVASMPPIINSEHTGKVSEHTKNIFVECTGLNQERVDAALAVVLCTLADNGGRIYPIKVEYPGKGIITPDFAPKKARISIKTVNNLLGLNLKGSEIRNLLLNARYDIAKADNKSVYVNYPAYRLDILNEVDIIEDIAIAYGYNRFIPETPKIACEGKLDEFELFCERLRNLMLGFGAQETLNFTLTNKQTLFSNMLFSECPVAEIANPVSSSWTVIRSSILPCLLEFLGKNTMQAYPQQVYEIGETVEREDKSEVRTRTDKMLCWVLLAKEVSYTNARQALERILKSLGLKYSIHETSHNSFIPGRVAGVKLGNKNIGILGEVHPGVLENFGLKMPAAAFEIDAGALYAELKRQ
ncbi:phenylalanine--tRNA ligase subunit beta [archaeon]|nr:phenylalanine--tRNA ligase subunit beta [archaeon]